MEWLAVRFRNGQMECQSRLQREEYLDYLIKEGKEVLSRVEKVFPHKSEAKAYCDKINEVNEIINKI